MGKGQFIIDTLESLVMTLILSGLSFEEGRIFFKAGMLLMESVNSNPNIDEKFLAEQCTKLVKQELAKAGIVH